MSEWLGGNVESVYVVDVVWLGLFVSIACLAASLGRSRVLPGSPPRSGQDSAVEFFDRRFAEGEIDPETNPAQRGALVRIVAVYRERERIPDHDGRRT
ncbi:hypothetical protein [Pengzhenrongella frigida]|uniref:Uncharacterized protein n=1 Tax=Pengzhenrongella frigida TaxID=1259133 RepID=A0A4Q5N103_9MICO|nr:hypothetical protein [Cellulomonas sp. HLT2-17]RYV49691.1 hypothetical protein EUA98_17375 [Cellulomonas sp. HLT2-17]